MQRTTTVAVLPRLGLALVLAVLPAWSTAHAGPPTEPRWSLVLSTAPHHPQDVWFTATGNNTDGWNGGGCICLGPLAQGLGPGDHATAQVEVLEGGIYGVDGTPVLSGPYFAPGHPCPPRLTRWSRRRVARAELPDGPWADILRDHAAHHRR